MEKKDEYIKYLEKRVNELEHKVYMEKTYDIDAVFKYYEEFLLNSINNKDAALLDNKKLWGNNYKLLKNIELNNIYIQYLLNSKWWKISFPLRKIWRTYVNFKYRKINYLVDYNNESSIDDKVTFVILFEDGTDLKKIIKNINNQKGVNDIEIIVVSNDKQLVPNIKGIKHIKLKDIDASNDQIYIQLLPVINGKYIVLYDSNTIINSDVWLYQSLVPIIDNDTLCTIFLNDKTDDLKNNTFYKDLKQRIQIIDGKQVLFMPKNRDLVEYLEPSFLDKGTIIIKKRISNYYLI